MLADYHVHTEFSDDSVYPMEQVIKDAIAMKMDEICFTDHVDYGIKEDWDCGHPIQYRGKNRIKTSIAHIFYGPLITMFIVFNVPLVSLCGISRIIMILNCRS